MSKKLAVASIDVAGLDALLERIQPVVSEEDHALLVALVRTMLTVVGELRASRTTVVRLRRFLGVTSSEKTSKILASGSGASPPSPGASPGPTTPPSSPPSETGTGPAASNDSAGEPDAENTCAPPGAEAEAKGSPPRPGHGRIPADGYRAARCIVPHATLRAGKPCPACGKGTLYAKAPAPVLRIVGQPPLSACRWDCECLRCSACGTTFTATPPEEARGPKMAESAVAMIAVLHYAMGMPFERLASTHRYFGVPLPPSTQWEAVRDGLPSLQPVYVELVALAADADVIFTDDTYGRVMSVMGKRRAKLVESGTLEAPERTGIFTTGVVAKTSAGIVALYATGRQHAGENLADLLDQRDPTLPSPIHMCDGLDRNRPEDHYVVESNCLAHARRPLVEQIVNHGELCAHALVLIGNVFHNDALCRRDGLSDADRLAFHQRESEPVMKQLRAWMENLLETKQVEPNSGLGEAFRYSLKRWHSLTAFLRLPGAPLDNNVVERILKWAIRYRRNSLFYLTEAGAKAADVYMALICTCELHGGDPYRYLTALLTHEKAVAASPADWLPWNYEAALASVAPPAKHAA